MEYIYPFVLQLKDEFKIYWRLCVKIIETLFIKDPCKKCIVRACCSEKCELKTFISNYYGDIDGNLGYQKLMAVSIIIGIILLIYSLVRLILSLI